MFETEVQTKSASAEDLPEDALSRFLSLREDVAARSLLPWAEHCTECAVPHCYSTCDFYDPRDDLKCRRFVDGIVPIALPGGHRLMSITFKQWGKLEAPGKAQLVPTAQSDRIENRDRKIGAGLQRLPVPYHLKVRLVRHRAYRKRRAARSGEGENGLPSHFVAECYNPQEAPVRFVMTMSPAGTDERRLPYQHACLAEPGYNRIEIPVAQIAAVLDLSADLVVSLVPEEQRSPVTLIFGLLDFVTFRDGARDEASVEPGSTAAKAKKAKCVVWDLDNTLWRGVLIENGLEALELRPEAVAAVQKLDERGVLNSVASKNDEAYALEALKSFGLDHYFLSPQMSWNPKSQMIATIAESLNISTESLVFIDDSEFERAEVSGSHPEVLVIDSADIDDLLDLPQFDLPVTKESRQRRSLYRAQERRSAAQDGFDGSYFNFLQDCNIELTIRPLEAAMLDRVYELAQRTNQMNFSGNRYDRGRLEDIAADPALDTFVLGCRDRFGDYGIIGFSVVERHEPRMIDLMFSCRVQGKRVEHAFLTHLLRLYRERGFTRFHADYRVTDRNQMSGRVFDDLSFSCVDGAAATRSLFFDLEAAPEDDGIIAILAEGRD